MGQCSGDLQETKNAGIQGFECGFGRDDNSCSTKTFPLATQMTPYAQLFPAHTNENDTTNRPRSEPGGVPKTWTIGLLPVCSGRLCFLSQDRKLLLLLSQK